jgi:hypothetical protein
VEAGDQDCERRELRGVNDMMPRFDTVAAQLPWFAAEIYQSPMEPITYLSPRTAIALAGTLVVAFMLCAILQAILPAAQFSHMWLQLFTAAPLGSLQAWIEASLRTP